MGGFEPGKRSLHCPDCGGSVGEDAVRCPFCDATLSLTACPSCFGPVFQGMRFCPACGAAVERAERPDASQKAKPCPRCDLGMAPIEVGGARIDECGRCGGLWMDNATLDALVQDRDERTSLRAHAPPPLPSAPPPAPTRFYIPCPVCGELMQRRNFAGSSGVVVDWCKPHGTWFDRRELQGILEWIEAGGLVEVRQAQIAALEEKKRELKAMSTQDRPVLWADADDGESGRDFTIARVLGAFFKGLSRD